MSTISEKLIQLKNIKQDIKDAINSGGGNVGDDFSTYAGEVNKITSYENPDFYELRTQGGTNFDYIFYGYNGPDIDVSNWDTSRVTSAQHCFESCKKSMDINNWDLSSLTNAYYMFYGFTNNNTYLDLSAFDFSNVSKVDYMFSYSNTDYLDVRNINLTGATDYSSLFDGCSGTELDLSNWDISNVTNLNYTFKGCEHKKIDLTGWRTTNVKNFYCIFYGYSSKLTHLIIPDWDMTNATYVGDIFNNSASYFRFKYIDLSRSNDVTISKITPFLLAYTATTFGDILVPSDTSQDVLDALIAKYWKPIGPKFDLISTEPVFELDEIKPGKTTKVWTGNSDPWYGDDRLETIEFISSDESIATVDGRVITSTGVEGTVEISARNKETQAILGSKTLSISEIDNHPNLIVVKTNGEETSNSSILYVNKNYIRQTQCTKIANNIYSYDPGVQITNFSIASSSASYISDIIKFNFNAANLPANAYGLLSYYKGTTLDLSDWDTSNRTDLREEFNSSLFLESLDISGWDTSKVTGFYRAFYRCNKLIEINGVLDLSSVKASLYDTWLSLYEAFMQCYNLETVYLKNIYKNSKMSNYSRWSIDLGDTKVKNECLLYIINELPNLYDKGITNNTTIVFTLPKTNTLTAEQVQVAIDKNWIVANITYEVNE